MASLLDMPPHLLYNVFAVLVSYQLHYTAKSGVVLLELLRFFCCFVCFFSATAPHNRNPPAAAHNNDAVIVPGVMEAPGVGGKPSACCVDHKDLRRRPVAVVLNNKVSIGCYISISILLVFSVDSKTKT